MFIRKKTKVDPKTLKKYFSYQLVESHRTERGPRQLILLTIGNSRDLSDEERKLLAYRIEEIVKGTTSFLEYPSHIYPNNLKNWIWADAKTPAIDRS